LTPAIIRTVLAILVALAVTAPAASAGGAQRSPSERMVERMNAVRGAHGLRPLRTAPRLTRTSRAYANRLMATDSFGHGSSYRHAGFRRSAEILAMQRGWSGRPRAAIGMWSRSPAHATLMLSREFRYVGASLARGRFGGGAAGIWVVHFGAH
jgi:uncharacterized protein YkwD